MLFTLASCMYKSWPLFWIGLGLIAAVWLGRAIFTALGNVPGDWRERRLAWWRTNGNRAMRATMIVAIIALAIAIFVCAISNLPPCMGASPDSCAATTTTKYPAVTALVVVPPSATPAPAVSGNDNSIELGRPEVGKEDTVIVPVGPTLSATYKVPDGYQARAEAIESGTQYEFHYQLKPSVNWYTLSSREGLRQSLGNEQIRAIRLRNIGEGQMPMRIITSCPPR
jgi:hypothetical protein